MISPQLFTVHCNAHKYNTILKNLKHPPRSYPLVRLQNWLRIETLSQFKKIPQNFFDKKN